MDLGTIDGKYTKDLGISYNTRLHNTLLYLSPNSYQLGGKNQQSEMKSINNTADKQCIYINKDN